MATDMICIVCPKGCHLSAAQTEGGEIEVRGAQCPKGVSYAKEELTAPTRMITSTVMLEGGAHARLPVKTAAPIPKEKIMDVVEDLRKVRIASPVKTGDIVLENAAGTGIAFIATRDL